MPLDIPASSCYRLIGGVCTYTALRPVLTFSLPRCCYVSSSSLLLFTVPTILALSRELDHFSANFSDVKPPVSSDRPLCLFFPFSLNRNPFSVFLYVLLYTARGPAVSLQLQSRRTSCSRDQLPYTTPLPLTDCLFPALSAFVLSCVSSHFLFFSSAQWSAFDVWRDVIYSTQLQSRWCFFMAHMQLCPLKFKRNVGTDNFASVSSSLLPRARLPLLSRERSLEKHTRAYLFTPLTDD